MSDHNIGSGIYSVKYTFTREELRELGLRLADKARSIANTRTAKLAAIAEFSSQIKTLEKDAYELVDKLNSLSEHRDMECAIHYHTPKHGFKTVIRPDTGETVRDSEPMSEAEMQSSFVFVDAPPKGKKDKPQ